MIDFKKAGWLFFSILLIDQLTKIYVKTHFVLGETYEVFSWFNITFVENEGAAWGMKLPFSWGKLALTIFRVIAVSAIGIWLYKLIQKKTYTNTLIFSIILIFSGAVGNIIDSVFYGMIFSSSLYDLATWFPEETYSGFMYGHVVDMFSLPLVDTILPNWVPFFGGERFVFFEYVFNVSDFVISIGGVLLVFFYKELNK